MNINSNHNKKLQQGLMAINKINHLASQVAELDQAKGADLNPTPDRVLLYSQNENQQLSFNNPDKTGFHKIERADVSTFPHNNSVKAANIRGKEYKHVGEGKYMGHDINYTLEQKPGKNGLFGSKRLKTYYTMEEAPHLGEPGKRIEVRTDSASGTIEKIKTRNGNSLSSSLKRVLKYPTTYLILAGAGAFAGCPAMLAGAAFNPVHAVLGAGISLAGLTLADKIASSRGK